MQRKVSQNRWIVVVSQNWEIVFGSHNQQFVVVSKNWQIVVVSQNCYIVVAQNCFVVVSQNCQVVMVSENCGCCISGLSQYLGMVAVPRDGHRTSEKYVEDVALEMQRHLGDVAASR